jgi:hypothetical protein
MFPKRYMKIIPSYLVPLKKRKKRRKKSEKEKKKNKRTRVLIMRDFFSNLSSQQGLQSLRKV